MIEVSGVGSFYSHGGPNFTLGNVGSGEIIVRNGGLLTSASTITVASTATSVGSITVDGAGSRLNVTGNLTTGTGDGSILVSNGGVISTTTSSSVSTAGRVAMAGGRWESSAASPAAINVFGLVQGSGVIDVQGVTTSSGTPRGQIRTSSGDYLLLTGTLTNAGEVDLAGGELEVRGAVINNGDIDARNGATLRFGGTGLVNNSGSQLSITSGTVDVFGLVNNDAGAEIAVGGTAVAVFHDVVTNGGTIFVQPGGEILMLENLGFSPTGALSVELQAIDDSDPDTEPSDAFGQVQVGGTAALVGTLEVSLVDGFMPMAGDAFQILTAGGGRTGIFTTEILPALSGGLNWDVQYNPDSLVLSVISAGLPGDYNQDGSVDAADYVVWRKNEGTTNPLPNDPIGGTIDADQYNQWRTHFGQPTGNGPGAGAKATAPEPATLVLLMFAAAGWCVLRRPAA